MARLGRKKYIFNKQKRGHNRWLIAAVFAVTVLVVLIFLNGVPEAAGMSFPINY